jgi:predicted ATP-dependent serine protease
VSGGHRISDPCGDLPIAVAIASSFSGVVWEQGALCGELALTGAVRGVTHHEARRVACKARGVALVDRAHLTDCLRIDQKPPEDVATKLQSMLIRLTPLTESDSD